MKSPVAAVLMLAASLVCSPLFAEEARPLADDPVAEQRLQGIAAELRCLVCQNETIAASNASLAQDLRAQIREQIKAGKSDGEITDYMVARYGDFVLYRPPFKTSTLLLWGGPAALLILGLALLRRYLKRRAATLSAAPPLSAEDAKMAASLLADASSDSRPQS